MNISEHDSTLSPSPSPSQKDKNWAMFAHLSSLLGFILPPANIVAPLIMSVIKKEEYPFGSEEAKECLNFQISMTIYFIVAGILCLVLIGFLILPILVIMDFVFTILAAVATSEGRAFHYPLTIRLVK